MKRDIIYVCVYISDVVAAVASAVTLLLVTIMVRLIFLAGVEESRLTESIMMATLEWENV